MKGINSVSVQAPAVPIVVLIVSLIYHLVVSSDPKSRNGTADKNSLMQTYVCRRVLLLSYTLRCSFRIHAHGGKCVQVCRDDPNLLVVYGGQTTRKHAWILYSSEASIDVLPKAYDIKLVMNKDVCDIIRPQWILDSVAKEDLVPLTKKWITLSGSSSADAERHSDTSFTRQQLVRRPKITMRGTVT